MRVAHGHVLFALATALSGASCTVLSGWSDLQDGARGGGGTADASVDARGAGSSSSGSGSSSSSSSSSSSGGADAAGASAVDASDGAPPVDTRVACGSARCAPPQGCCAGVLGAATCQTGSQSCAPPSVLATCSDSAACTAELGHSAQCCASSTSGIPSVACRTTCNSGDRVVCDPTAAQPGCAAGQTCVSSPDGFSYDVCQ